MSISRLVAPQSRLQTCVRFVRGAYSLLGGPRRLTRCREGVRWRVDGRRRRAERLDESSSAVCPTLDRAKGRCRLQAVRDRPCYQSIYLRRQTTGRPGPESCSNDGIEGEILGSG